MPIVQIPHGGRGYYRLRPQHLGADTVDSAKDKAEAAEERRWRRWERASTVLLVLTSAVSLAASLGWFKPKG
jgi:hypothetical protein